MAEGGGGYLSVCLWCDGWMDQERYCLLRSSISSNLVKAGRNGTEQVLWHGPSSLQSLEGIVLR